MRTHTRAHWDCYFFFFFSANKDHLPCSLCQIKFRLPVFVLVSFLFFCPKNISRSHYPLAAFTVWHFYLFTIRLTFFLVSDWLFGGGYLEPLWSCKTLMDPFLSREEKNERERKSKCCKCWQAAGVTGEHRYSLSECVCMCKSLKDVRLHPLRHWLCQPRLFTPITSLHTSPSDANWIRQM